MNTDRIQNKVNSATNSALLNSVNLNKKTPKSVMNGAEIFLKCLEEEGVEHIFGIPGGVILPIYDALCKNKNLTHILTKHEQGAVHAADGYAKSTGKVGVALTTSGPGATNTVTGLTDAFYDSVPIVVFTGNVTTSMLGNDAFQEADIVSITRACTKHNYIVRDVSQLTSIIKEAFYIARTGRPGPVLVDLPKDVLISSIEYNYPETVNLLGYEPYPQIDSNKISDILKELNNSIKPLVLCGGGVVSSDSLNELVSFSEQYHVPIVSTLMGLGGFPASHDNFVGFSGMHGNRWANLAIYNCDLLIILGSRLSDRQTGAVNQYCPNAKIIHIDLDPTSLNKTIKNDISIQGDIKQILELLLDYLKTNSVSAAKEEKRADWLEEINKYKKESLYSQKNNNNSKLKPAEVIEKVYELSAKDAFIATDVGQHQMWSAQYYNKNYPKRFITSGGLGTMGFGLPSALGVQLANPDAQVIVFAGDGSIQMNIQELATAKTYNLPVKIVIINNGYLGMVRQWQSFIFNRYSQSKIFSPDYVTLAKAYGIGGFKIEGKKDLKMLEEALNYPGPALIDCIVEEEEDVYPWVPVGKGNNEMLMEAK